MNIGEIMLGLANPSPADTTSSSASKRRRGCFHHNKQTLDVAEKILTEDKTWITSRTVYGEGVNKITVGRSLQYLKRSRSSMSAEQAERFDRIMEDNEKLKPERKSNYLKKAKKSDAKPDIMPIQS